MGKLYVHTHIYTRIYVYIYMHHASIKTGICLRWPKQIRHTISGFPNGGFPLTISGDVVTTGVMA